MLVDHHSPTHPHRVSRWLMRRYLRLQVRLHRVLLAMGLVRSRHRLVSFSPHTSYDTTNNLPQLRCWLPGRLRQGVHVSVCRKKCWLQRPSGCHGGRDHPFASLVFEQRGPANLCARATRSSFEVYILISNDNTSEPSHLRFQYAFVLSGWAGER
jgi:hypothetical protein